MNNSLRQDYANRGVSYFQRFKDNETAEILSKEGARKIRRISSDGTVSIEHTYSDGVVKRKQKQNGGNWELTGIKKGEFIDKTDMSRKPEELYQKAKCKIDDLKFSLQSYQEDLKSEEIQNSEFKTIYEKEIAKLKKEIAELEKLSADEQVQRMLHLTKGEFAEMKNMIRTNMLKRMETISKAFKL